jgi:putative transposase
MTLIWPTRLGLLLRRFCRPRGRVGDLALPTFVPSSTPSFTFLRTGCQWRLLPREFPPWGTVYHYFQAWQNAGVWVHLTPRALRAGPSRCGSSGLSFGGH